MLAAAKAYGSYIHRMLKIRWRVAKLVYNAACVYHIILKNKTPYSKLAWIGVRYKILHRLPLGSRIVIAHAGHFQDEFIVVHSSSLAISNVPSSRICMILCPVVPRVAIHTGVDSPIIYSPPL